MFLLPFAPRGNARLSYRAAFEQTGYCNLSIFDLACENILFHLSLRAEQGLAVLNRRTAEQWGHEIKRPVHLPTAGAEVVIDFEGNGVRVLLDGIELVAFSNRIRRQFPRLRRAGYADFYGGLVGPTLDMDIRVADPLGRNAALRLDGRLELRGTAEGALGLPDMDMPPSLARDANGLRALVPGRVWQSVPETEPLLISVGTETLEITRTALAARIDKMLVDGPEWHGDMRAAGQIIEHIRFARLLPLLSTEGQARLGTLLRKTGLTDFFLADGATWPDAPRAAMRMSALDKRLSKRSKILSAYLGAAALALRDDPAQWVSDWITRHKPPHAIRSQAFLALTELAANRDDPDEMAAFIAAAIAQGFKGFPKARSIWEISAQLPWVWHAGKHEDLAETVSILASAKDWITTPPLAWVMRRLAETPATPQGADIVRAFCAYINSQSGYWGRAACRRLTGSTAALVAAPHWDDATRAGLEETALAVYGLSPTFWEALPKGVLDKARFHFETMLTDPTDPNAAAFFENAGSIELPRFLRDHAAEREGGPAAVRHLAHPATPVSEANATAVAALARASIPTLYNETPISGTEPQRQGAQHEAKAVLEGKEDAKALVQSCAALGPLGVGLRLTIMAALLGQERADTAQQLWDAAPLPATLSRHPALDHAQAQLAQVRGHSLAGAALRRFADPVHGTTRHPMQDSASPLHDTLVCVFSCKAHLETRIPQMRAGWLGDLKAHGVPYVIIVGDGDAPEGRLDGDVLRLPVADDYEGLPEKTLGTIGWIHKHTSFSHMYKVDDDCFVNVPTLFGALDLMQHDYWGRPLTRVPGQMDRGWHTAKSTTPRGRLELDKSPEPSLYADGGSGYALSRRAMSAVLRAREAPQGQLLAQASFMEDKLLGDLLALEGFAVSGQDYLIAVRRRETPGGIPVPRWVNGFDASQTAPTKLVHLDDPAAQGSAHQRLFTPALRPAKLWPTFQDPQLGPNSNALEHISGPVEQAQTAPVSVVACMRNEMFMLPHFLAHYRSLGVNSFIIADNCSDDGTLEFLAEQPDVTLFSVDTDYGRSQYGVAWQQAIMAGLRPGKWSLMADADELLVWQHPQTQALAELLVTDTFKAANAARIFMLDMYPQGPLAEADFSKGDPFEQAGFTDAEPFRRDAIGAGPFSDSQTWTSALRHRLIPGSRAELFVAQKIALLRYAPHMRLTAGLHYVANTRIAPRELIFAHFKYNADFRRKAQSEVTRGQHFNDAEEYRKYLALVSEGRDVIFEGGVSVPWHSTAFARNIFDQGA